MTIVPLSTLTILGCLINVSCLICSKPKYCKLLNVEISNKYNIDIFQSKETNLAYGNSNKTIKNAINIIDRHVKNFFNSRNKFYSELKKLLMQILLVISISFSVVKPTVACSKSAITQSKYSYKMKIEEYNKYFKQASDFMSHNSNINSNYPINVVANSKAHSFEPVLLKTNLKLPKFHVTDNKVQVVETVIEVGEDVIVSTADCKYVNRA